MEVRGEGKGKDFLEEDFVYSEQVDFKCEKKFVFDDYFGFIIFDGISQ